MLMVYSPRPHYGGSFMVTPQTQHTLNNAPVPRLGLRQPKTCCYCLGPCLCIWQLLCNRYIELAAACYQGRSALLSEEEFIHCVVPGHAAGRSAAPTRCCESSEMSVATIKPLLCRLSCTCQPDSTSATTGVMQQVSAGYC